MQNCRLRLFDGIRKTCQTGRRESGRLTIGKRRAAKAAAAKSGWLLSDSGGAAFRRVFEDSGRQRMRRKGCRSAQPAGGRNVCELAGWAGEYSIGCQTCGRHGRRCGEPRSFSLATLPACAGPDRLL